MFVAFQAHHGKLAVVFGNKNLFVGLALQKVLENLEFDEFALQIIHGRVEARTDVLQQTPSAE